MTPVGFAHLVRRGKFLCPPHVALMNQNFMRLAARETMNQATFAPPRHGKTEFNTIICPAWYLCCFRPDHWIINAAYGADLAEKFGGRIRDIIEEWGPHFGVRLNSDTRGKQEWELEYLEEDGRWTHGGGVFSVGMPSGGTIGRGAHLLNMDDPIKTPDEARSKSTQDKLEDWYMAVGEFRMEPGGIKNLTMTPWQPGDIGDRILTNEGEKWNVLRMPALAESYDPSISSVDKTGYEKYLNQVDPLGRQPGESLWPERFKAEDLLAKKGKTTKSIFWFNCQYQCTPKMKSGGIFEEDWFRANMVAAAPAKAKRVRAWDRAATQGGGDATASVKMSKDSDGVFYVEDMTEDHLSEFKRNRLMMAKAETDGKMCYIATEQEGGSSGKIEAASIVRMFAGHRITVKPSTGSKAVRAQPYADQVEAGNVKLVRGPWNERFIQAHCDFKGDDSGLDDIPDAASQAFTHLNSAKVACSSAAGGERRISQELERALA